MLTQELQLVICRRTVANLLLDFLALLGVDERIVKTQLKKASLLLVLDHPEIPLHNNPAELGARHRVRKRDVSFGPRTPDGAKAWDTFMTLTATAKKLGVSIYHYIHDRVSGAFELPDLAYTTQSRNAPPNCHWAHPGNQHNRSPRIIEIRSDTP